MSDQEKQQAIEHFVAEVAEREIKSLRKQRESQREYIDKLGQEVTELRTKLYDQQLELPLDEPEVTGVDVDVEISDLKVALFEAELKKEKHRHNKLQLDISRFFEVLGESDDSSLTPNGLLMLFDTIREGK